MLIIINRKHSQLTVVQNTLTNLLAPREFPIIYVFPQNLDFFFRNEHLHQRIVLVDILVFSDTNRDIFFLALTLLFVWFRYTFVTFSVYKRLDKWLIFYGIQYFFIYCTCWELISNRWKIERSSSNVKNLNLWHARTLLSTDFRLGV